MLLYLETFNKAKKPIITVDFMNARQTLSTSVKVFWPGILNVNN